MIGALEIKLIVADLLTEYPVEEYGLSQIEFGMCTLDVTLVYGIGKCVLKIGYGNLIGNDNAQITLFNTIQYAYTQLKGNSPEEATSIKEVRDQNLKKLFNLE